MSGLEYCEKKLNEMASRITVRGDQDAYDTAWERFI